MLPRAQMTVNALFGLGEMSDPESVKCANGHSPTVARQSYAMNGEWAEVLGVLSIGRQRLRLTPLRCQGSEGCRSMQKRSGLDPRPLALLRRNCLAVIDSLRDPGFHFFRDPRDSTGTKLYPLGEFTGSFEARNVRRAVGDTIDRFEFLLGYQLPCHCKSLVKGTLQRPG